MLKRRAAQWALIIIGIYFLMEFIIAKDEEKWLEGTWTSDESTFWITESSITFKKDDEVISGAYEVIDRYHAGVLVRVNIRENDDMLVYFDRIGSDSLKSGDEYWERSH